MFADVTPGETTGLMASFSWSTLAGVAALVVLVALAWQVARRHGLPRIDLSDLLREVLVKRSGSPAANSSTGDDREDEPAAQSAAPVRRDAATDHAEDAAPGNTEAAQGEMFAPQREAERLAAGAPSTGAIKALIVAAALPSLFALPYIAWSIADLLMDRINAPFVAALTAGVVADIALIGSVIVALADPASRASATRWGWLFAVAASALVAIHAGWSAAAFVAVIPLLSKALWGLVVSAVHRLRAARAAHAAAVLRRKEEAAAEKSRREGELSTDLEHERQAEIAQLERDALYEEKVAAAKLKKKLAVSHAEHLEALAEIERLGEQKRSEDEESAKVYENQLRLSRKMRTLAGESPAFLSGADGVDEAEVVGEITATSKAGFGGGAPAFGFQRPLDVKALTPEGASVRFEELPEHHQALVRYAHTAKEPTMREAGRRLDKDQRTIGRWVEKLAEHGYELPFDRKK